MSSKYTHRELVAHLTAAGFTLDDADCSHFYIDGSVEQLLEPVFI